MIIIQVLNAYAGNTRSYHSNSVFDAKSLEKSTFYWRITPDYDCFSLKNERLQDVELSRDARPPLNRTPSRYNTSISRIERELPLEQSRTPNFRCGKCISVKDPGEKNAKIEITYLSFNQSVCVSIQKP